jgi:hypothetical protein
MWVVGDGWGLCGARDHWQLATIGMKKGYFF